MMSNTRASLVLGVVCWHAAARVNDENCLVQVQSTLGAVQRRQAAQEPPPPSTVALHLDRSRKLPRQLPCTWTPLCTLRNLSADDLEAYGLEFVQLLKDPARVDLLLESLHNVSAGLLGTSEELRRGAGIYDEALDKAGNESEVLEATRDFLARLEKVAAQAMANVIVDGNEFWTDVPSDNRLKKMLKPLLATKARMTKEQVSAIVMSAMSVTLDVMSKDWPTFCAASSPVVTSLSAASKWLKEQGSGVVDSVRRLVLEVPPRLEALTPGMAPTVMTMVNKSLDVLADLIASAQESVPAASASLAKAAQDKLRCPLPGSEQSGAPLVRARFGLAAALAAAAAWLPTS